MSKRIPFSAALFPPLDRSLAAIEARLTKHYWKIHSAGEGLGVAVPAGHRVAENQRDKVSHGRSIPWPVKKRIERRSLDLAEAYEAQSGLSHLKPNDRQRLQVLRDGVALVSIRSEHQADELAAALHDEFPWMGAATEEAWRGMRRSVSNGDPGLRLAPMLLDGPPGIGKSRWARRLAELLGAPLLKYEATNESASFGLVGSQRGWGNATPGRLLQLVLATLVGNPVVIVDEVEKAGEARSTKGKSFDLAASLLPLLEQETASSWTCPYHEVSFDMSWIIWIMATNNHRLLPAPLLSRCPPIRLPALSLDDLIGFTRRQGLARDLSDASVEAIVEALKGVPLAAHQLSLRTVLRLLDRASDLERSPLKH